MSVERLVLLQSVSLIKIILGLFLMNEDTLCKVTLKRLITPYGTWDDYKDFLKLSTFFRSVF